MSFLTGLSIVLQVFSLSIGLYYFFVGLNGFIKRKEQHPKISDKLHRYALIISAHNEEAVIANMVESLKKLDYPKEYYDIYVIADNCTDNTAAIAKEAGAIVYKRFDEANKTKGHALNWFINQKID